MCLLISIDSIDIIIEYADFIPKVLKLVTLKLIFKFYMVEKDIKFSVRFLKIIMVCEYIYTLGHDKGFRFQLVNYVGLFLEKIPCLCLG